MRGRPRLLPDPEGRAAILDAFQRAKPGTCLSSYRLTLELGMCGGAAEYRVNAMVRSLVDDGLLMVAPAGKHIRYRLTAAVKPREEPGPYAKAEPIKHGRGSVWGAGLV